jgi:hypothetical protein
MKKLLIPVFCLWHMLAITWWTLPYSFGALVNEQAVQDNWEARLFNWGLLAENVLLQNLIARYIDVTGSQQYWDFFAPQSPKFHQYLSVCNGIEQIPDAGDLGCKQKTLFSNFNSDFAAFRLFGSDRSRIYRLTENLINRPNQALLSAFMAYYARHADTHNNPDVYLIAHQFDLHPELKDMPRWGYRNDQVLLANK